MQHEIELRNTYFYPNEKKAPKGLRQQEFKARGRRCDSGHDLHEAGDCFGVHFFRLPLAGFLGLRFLHRLVATRGRLGVVNIPNKAAASAP
jgi:hypothetical protein